MSIVNTNLEILNASKAGLCDYNLRDNDLNSAQEMMRKFKPSANYDYVSSKAVYKGKEYLVVNMQDTSNGTGEPLNKRIQMKNTKIAVTAEIGLIGLYPLVKDGKVYDLMYLVWTDYEVSRLKGKGSPAVKVKVQEIQEAYNTKKDMKSKILKYKCNIQNDCF